MSFFLVPFLWACKEITIWPKSERLTATLISLQALCLFACGPKHLPPGPPIQTPQLAGDLYLTADGLSLPLRSWLPETSPVAVVLALHGFNDYGYFIKDAASTFTAAGIALYALDQRGFGATPNRGIWPGTQALTGDLVSLASLLRRRYPAIPLLLLGESMGGAVIMAAMTAPAPSLAPVARPPSGRSAEATPPADGIILAAPAVWGRRYMPFYQRWLMDLGAKFFPETTVTGESLKITASDNIEMLRALGRDPLIIKKTRLDTITGLADLMDLAYEGADRITLPTLYLYGKKDEIIPEEPTLAVMDRIKIAGGGSKQINIYPDGYHMLMRDLQASVVLADITAWITITLSDSTRIQEKNQTVFSPDGSIFPKLPTE